jgi:hypothetical protein
MLYVSRQILLEVHPAHMRTGIRYSTACGTPGAADTDTASNCSCACTLLSAILGFVVEVQHPTQLICAT